MSNAGSRTASLGRNPSADHMKRRKSWQSQDRPFRDDSVPDVRAIIGPQRLKVPPRRRWPCTSSDGDLVRGVLFLLGTIALASLMLLIIAIAFHSSLVYPQWTIVRDDTTQYVNHVDRLQVIILVSVFAATAAIMVASYALFCFVSKRLKSRASRKRHIALYGDTVINDLEIGSPELQTKKSIAKLMSDAEKQYIAEYSKKQGAEEKTAGEKGVPSSSPNVISVQRLTESAPVATRTWSLKRLWKDHQPIIRGDLAPKGAPPGDAKDLAWHADPTQMAAHLSSPNAFHRASIAHQPAPLPVSTQSRSASPSGAATIESRESTLSDGDISRTRIMVTMPVESYAVRVSTDSEDDEFDKRRQHSIVPHPAGEHPFQSQILASGDFGHGWHEVELGLDAESSASGHLVAQSSTQTPSSSAETLETFDLVPRTHTADSPAQALGTIELSLEEVLPRPQSGLLNRLLRLAKVECTLRDGQPVFSIQPEKEYMMNFKVQMEDDSDLRLALKWMRIWPPDGQAVRFNIEESSRKDNQWIGSACWDICLHNSDILNSVGDSKQVTPLAMSLWAETNDNPPKRIKMEAALHITMTNPRERQSGTAPHASTEPMSKNSAAFFIVQNVS